jgi:hypothetical protein
MNSRFEPRFTALEESTHTTDARFTAFEESTHTTDARFTALEESTRTTDEGQCTCILFININV